MKKILQWMFLLVLVGTIGTLQAQTSNYACDFESDDALTEWHIDNGASVNHWVIGSAINNTVNGDKSLYVSGDSIDSHSYNESEEAFIGAYVELDLTAGVYNVSFDWLGMGEGVSWDYMRVALLPETESVPTSMPSDFYSNTLPANWIAVDGGTQLNGSNLWATSFSEVYVGNSGTYKFTVFWKCDGSGGNQPSGAIDNILLEEQTCLTPTVLLATNILSDGATLHWVESGLATEWQLEYGPTGFTRGSGTLVSNLSETSYVLNNLLPNTEYDVYVESVCGASDISNAVQLSFRTACGSMVLPYHDSFETQNEDETPLCWTAYAGDVIVDNYASNAYNGSMVLKLKNNAVAITPHFATPANEVGIHLAVKPHYPSSCGNLEIGFVSDIDAWDYVALQTITPSLTEYRLYEVDLDAVSGAMGGYIVIRQVDATAESACWYIDEVSVFELGTCRMASDFSITSVTDNGATINWSCPSTNVNFQIKCSTTGESPVDTIFSTLNHEHTIALSGLESNTIYNVNIRTVCDNDNTTPWQYVGTFSTEMLCANLVQVSVASITATTASLNWMFSNFGISIPTNVYVRYKSSAESGWNELNVSGNGCNLTGLTPSMNYDVLLAVVCGSDTSSVMGTFFRTMSDNCGEITGDGNSTLYQSPLNGSYNYNFSQSIYPSVIFEGMDTITGIIYNTTNSDMYRSFSLYMANTTLNTFVRRGDYIPASAMTKVYSGTTHFLGEGYDTILFSTPFITNGDNVVVMINDTTNSYNFPNSYFYSHAGSAFYDNNDGMPYDANNPHTMYLLTEVPDAIFMGNCKPITCKSPSVVVAQNNVSSITLSWIPGLNESSWSVDYRAMGSEAWTNVSASVIDTFFTVDNLMASSAYEFRVGALCSGQTKYGYAMGYTACDVLTIPYTETFSVDNLPCWRMAKFNYNRHSDEIGIRSGKLFLPAHSYAILPQMNATINTLQIRFKLNASDGNAPLIFGVVAEQNNMSTFVPVDTVYMDFQNPLADNIVEFSSYMGTYNHLAMMTGRSAMSIDNLVVESIPACPQPLHLHTTYLAGTTATIDWDNNPMVQNWQVIRVNAGEDIATGEIFTTNQNSIELNGLNPHTSYDIYVRAACASDVMSAYTKVSLTTMSTDPISLPYRTDFTDMTQNTQWSFYESNVSIMNKWAIGSDANNGNANAIYVSNDNGISNAYSTGIAGVSFAYIPIEVANDAQYAIAYDWRCQGESNYDFGRVALVPGNYDFDRASTTRTGYLNSLPDEWLSLDNGSKMNQSTGWNHDFNIVNLTAGNYKLVLMWGNDAGGGEQPPMAIDNLSFVEITCPQPTDLTVSDVTSTTATLSWNSDPNVTNGYEIILNDEPAVTTTENSYTFSDLDPGSSNIVKVRAICASNDSSFYSSTMILTNCGDIVTIPYFNNFNTNVTATMGATPHCWTAGTDGYPSVSTLYSETPSLHFYTYESSDSDNQLDNMVSLPRLNENYQLSDLEIQFIAKSTYTAPQNILYVGVCSDPSDASTFTPIDTINGFTDEWNTYFVSFANYTGTDRYITFYTQSVGVDNYARIMVDDVMLHTPAMCKRPVAAYIDSYTHNSATIGWTDTNAMATFNVAYSTQSNVLLAEHEINDIPVSPYTISGLNGNTTYYVWVAANCTDYNTVSDWIYAGNFTTEPACAPVTNLKAIDVDESHATLTWTTPIVGETITDFIISYQKNNETPVIDTVQSNYYFMSNLETNATYSVSITTMCDALVGMQNSITFIPQPIDCVTMGTGTEEIYNCPVPGMWNYGLSQMLFFADELSYTSDTIRGISLDPTYGGATREVAIYMAETDIDEFGSSFQSLDNMTLVYQGSWTIMPNASLISFTNPFIRTDRTKNVILAIDDNTGSYDGGNGFRATMMNKNVTLYTIRDDADITDITDVENILMERPNVVFDANCNLSDCMAPSVVISSITDTQIDIAWRAGNDETAWRVEYRLAGAQQWQVAQANTSLTNISFTDLIPGSQYEIRVGAICQSETSYRNLTAVTMCGPMPLPFHEDFSDYAPSTFSARCWATGGMNAPQVNNILGNGQMLRLYDDSYVVLPMMQGTLDSLQIRLRYFAPTNNAWTLVGYIENPSKIATFHVIDTLYDSENITGLYHTILLNTIPAGIEGYLAFYTPHDINYTFIDDITIEPIRSCAEPIDVMITNVSASDADVAWLSSANNFIVEYGPEGFLRGTGTSVTVNAHNVHLSGLEASHRYDLYVYAICGANDTSYFSNVAHFATECGALTSLPYVMNFELPYLPPTMYTGVLPYCWNTFVYDTLADQDSHPQVIYDAYGQYVANGDYVLKMETSSLVVLPQFAANLNTLCLRFNNVFTASSSRLVVGVLSHVNDHFESTFQPIDTIAPVSVGTSERYAIYFDGYTGNDHCIAFKNIDVTPNYTISEQYIDSLVVETIPQCAEVSNIRVVRANASSITIDWTDHSAATTWQIEYGPQGFELGTGTQIIANAHTPTVGNLESLTAYDFWVRPICSTSDTGYWGYRPLTASTLICDTSAIAIAAFGEADGRTTNAPFGVFFNTSYSQTIIDADYLSGQGDISAIQFNDNHDSDGKLTGCRIWIGHTNKLQFDNGSDWISINNMQLVFTGDLNYTAGDVVVRLDSIFTYDGQSNLVVAIDRDANTYQGSHEFAYVSDTVAKTIYQHHDNYNQDPASPAYEGVLDYYHTLFTFISCVNNTCSTPNLGEVTNITHESATIHWDFIDDNANFEVALRMQSESDLSDPVVITGSDYTFNNLLPNTTYMYYLRHVCGEGDYSVWAEGDFTTTNLPCHIPSDLFVDQVTAESVTLSWNADEGQSQWTLHVFNTLEDYFDTVTINPATITGLTAGVAYRASINAICAEGYASEWSDTIEFTTEDCEPVSNVAVNEITKNSAKIVWTASEDASMWEINYGESGFGQGDGEFVESNATNYTITNLEPAMDYDVYVRTLCAEDFTSIWSDVVTFTTLNDDTPEGIDGVDGNFQFTIYPNPTSNSTTISLNGIDGKVEISIVDMNGRMLQTETIECGFDCEKSIDVTDLAQGTYFVRVLGDNINSVRKLIVR